MNCNNLYLGIDVSKGYADFCLINPERKVLGKIIQFFDIKQGHEQLQTYLDKVLRLYSPKVIYAAAESTGSYEDRWIEKLYSLTEKFPIKVARLNPLTVLRHRQSSLKQQITDKTSSQAIAEYLLNNSDIITYYKPCDYADCRIILKHLDLLNKQKTQMTNKLHQHLYHYFPQIVPYSRNSMPKWILHLLVKYPTASKMSRAKQGKKNKIPYLKTLTWKNLKAHCKSDNPKCVDPIIEELIVDTVKQIQQYSRKIDQTIEKMKKKLPKEKLDILTSMPGISNSSAIRLLSLIGDIRRFKSARQMVGYFGLYPVIKESGDGKKKPHMSKKGSSIVRKTLYMNAMSCVQHSEHMKSIYNAALRRGKSERSATCLIMQKMLRMIYGMLTANECYNPIIDKANREKFRPKTLVERTIQTRECSSEENKMVAMAPISRKNNLYRKEQSRAYAQNQSSYRSLDAPSLEE